MDIERITTWEDLAALRHAWDTLADDVPFRRWDWLATWWKHYGHTSSRSQDLFVLAVYDTMPPTHPDRTQTHGRERRLIGIAPWLLRHSPVIGTTIELLGEEEVCSDHLTLLSEPEESPRVAAALADYLATEFQNWDLLSLYGIDDNDPVTIQLCEALQACGFEKVIRRSAYRTWRISLPANWDEYFQRLSKSHRKHNKRAVRRVHQSGTYAFRSVATRDAFQALWPVLERLHQKRWTRREHIGCFASSRFTQFHREVATRMLENGLARLSVIEISNQPICLEYALTGSGTTYAYQSGIDPDYLALEPGRLGTLATIQQAIAEGHTTFDFLRGDEPYKPHWRAEPVTAWHLRIANHHAMAHLRNAGWLAKEWLKSKVAPDRPVPMNP